MSKEQQIYDFLSGCPCFYVATCDGDKPRVRPFGFMMLHEGRLYMGMGDHKESYRQVRANPNIEICTMHPDGRVIRIKAVAVFDLSDAAQEHQFEVSPGLRELYNERTGHRHATFYLTDIDAEISDKGTFTPILDD